METKVGFMQFIRVAMSCLLACLLVMPTSLAWATEDAPALPEERADASGNSEIDSSEGDGRGELDVPESFDPALDQKDPIEKDQTGSFDGEEDAFSEGNSGDGDVEGDSSLGQNDISTLSAAPALPANDAADKTLKGGYPLAGGVSLLSAPSTGAPQGAFFPEGTRLSFYLWDAAGEWGWCWKGSARYYLPLSSVDVLPANDAAGASLRTGSASQAATIFSDPSSFAPQVGTVSSGQSVSYYPWDAAGKWGWFWKGSEKRFLSLADVDTLPANDAADKTLKGGYPLAGGVSLLSAPSTGAPQGAFFPEGTRLSFYLWDAAGEWGWCWKGSARYYLPLSSVDVLPANDAAGASLRTGSASQAATIFSDPSSFAPQVGTVSSGQSVSYYPWDAAGKWGWFWKGNARYFFRTDAVGLANDAVDTNQHKGFFVVDTPYFAVPDSGGSQIGTVNAGQEQVYYYWDEAHVWGWFWEADSRRFFRLENIAPANDASDVSLQQRYAFSATNYYTAPSVRAAIGGKTDAGLVSYYPWDAAGEWGWFWRGDVKYFIFLNSLGPVNDGAGVGLLTGQLATSVAYYAAPLDGTSSLGTLSSGLNVSYYLWDAAGKWGWFWKGDTRYFFLASFVIASNDATTGTLQSGYILASAGYYDKPSFAGTRLGAVSSGQIASYYPWDAAGRWGWFWRGSTKCFLDLSNVAWIPPNNASDVSLHSGIALEGARYYAQPTAQIPSSGVLPSGSACSFYLWDKDYQWGWFWKGDARYFIDLSSVTITGTTRYNITLSALVTLQGMASSASSSTLSRYMNPANFPLGTSEHYQFALLDRYMGVPADRLNAVLQKAGVLKGQGEAFLAAAKSSNINEVYFVSHMIVETGWGTSTLAKGQYYNGGDLYTRDGKLALKGGVYPAGTYYNYFGIGAFDADANGYGLARAVKEGWNTQSKAIAGAATWINNGYIRGSWNQNTLYEMRWDPQRTADNKVASWHQYATDPAWATTIALVMGNVVSDMGYIPNFIYDVPVYLQ